MCYGCGMVAWLLACLGGLFEAPNKRCVGGSARSGGAGGCVCLGVEGVGRESWLLLHLLHHAST